MHSRAKVRGELPASAGQRIPGGAIERSPQGRPPPTDRKQKYAKGTAPSPKHINAFGPTLLANRSGHITAPRSSPWRERPHKYIWRSAELRGYRPKLLLSGAVEATDNSKSLPGRSQREDLRPSRSDADLRRASVGAAGASPRQLLRTPPGDSLLFPRTFLPAFPFSRCCEHDAARPAHDPPRPLSSGSFPLLCHRYRDPRGLRRDQNTTHLYDWHLCTLVRINYRSGMKVSVEYFDDVPREPLCLTEEQWGIKALLQPKVAARAGSAADKLGKGAKTG